MEKIAVTMAGKAVAILAVSWIETFFGLLFLTLRFLSNLKFVGRFRWDFWIALLTVVSGFDDTTNLLSLFDDAKQTS